MHVINKHVPRLNFSPVEGHNVSKPLTQLAPYLPYTLKDRGGQEDSIAEPGMGTALYWGSLLLLQLG